MRRRRSGALLARSWVSYLRAEAGQLAIVSAFDNRESYLRSAGYFILEPSWLTGPETRLNRLRLLIKQVRPFRALCLIPSSSHRVSSVGFLLAVGHQEHQGSDVQRRAMKSRYCPNADRTFTMLSQKRTSSGQDHCEHLSAGTDSTRESARFADSHLRCALPDAVMANHDRTASG